MSARNEGKGLASLPACLPARINILRSIVPQFHVCVCVCVGIWYPFSGAVACCWAIFYFLSDFRSFSKLNIYGRFTDSWHGAGKKLGQKDTSLEDFSSSCCCHIGVLESCAGLV